VHGRGFVKWDFVKNAAFHRKVSHSNELIQVKKLQVLMFGQIE